MGLEKKNVFQRNNENISEQEAVSSVKETASEWFVEQMTTVKKYDSDEVFKEEDDEAEHEPQRSRILIAAEDNEEDTMITASVKATSLRLLTNSFVKVALKDEDVKLALMVAATKLKMIDRIYDDKKMPAAVAERLRDLINFI